MRKQIVAGTCAVVAAIGIFIYAGSGERNTADVEGDRAAASRLVRPLFRTLSRWCLITARAR